MTLLSNLSTRSKLVLSFGTIILVIISIIILSYFSVTKIRSSGEELAHKMLVARNLTQLRSDENRMRALALELIVLKGGSHFDEIIGEVNDRVKQVGQRVEEIQKDLSSSPAEAKISGSDRFDGNL